MILIHLCYFTLCINFALNFGNIVGDINNTRLQDVSSTLERLESRSHILDDKWTTDAIKDIAYYLRDHKFNEWDRRNHHGNTTENQVGFFSEFPTPPLKIIHWEVKANCHHDFYKCITYLHSIVETAPNSRVEDTTVLLKDNIRHFNENTMKRLDYDCKERYAYAQKVGLPFDDPVEKFQWRTSASYYMCWYTMLGTPPLIMVGEFCDNFANCLDSTFGTHNHDPRGDDKLPFHCSKYSFCPDPCCPIKHIDSFITCYDNERNPCFAKNAERDQNQRKCHVDRRLNQNLKDIINNKWNLSCSCNDGFEWKSEFGICVNINKCLL